MLEKHPDIDQRQILMVNFVTFGASAVEFFIYTFAETTDWQAFHRVKENVLLKISAIVREQNAEIAFPTQTVHLQMQNEPTL
jgi:MscS family membrane protein